MSLLASCISGSIPATRTQADQRAGATSTSGGVPAVQISARHSHRGANAHDVATSSGEGTEPGIAAMRDSRRSTGGSESSRPSVYGCSGSASIASAAATSSTDPA